MRSPQFPPHSARLLATILLAWLLPACTTTPPSTTPETTRRAPVNPGDKLRVSIFELITPETTYTADLTVDENGFITLPKLGPLRVGGLTPDAIKSVIEKVATWDPLHGISAPQPPEIKVDRLGNE